MAIGHPLCSNCRCFPAYKFQPCRHTSCEDHYVYSTNAGHNVCGVCSRHIDRFDVLIAITPLTDPTSTFTTTSFLSPAAPSYTMPASTGHGRADNWDGLPPRRPHNNYSPTPNAQGNMKKNSSDDGQARARYVVPPLRAVPEDHPIRPESSASNATLASQVPAGEHRSQRTPFTSIDLPRAAQQASGGHLRMPSRQSFATQPRELYSYSIVEELEREVASHDPFFEPRRRSSGQQPTYQADHSTGVLSSNVHRLGSDIDNAFASTAIPPHPSFGPTSMTATSTAYAPHNQGLRRDSGASNAYGHDMARAVRLADFIKSGGTDDPKDINYGNPGPSKRLPPVSEHKVAEMPRPRGNVININSTTLTVSNSEANTKGNAAAFLGHDRIAIPAWLPNVSSGYQPSLEEVYRDLPVMEACRIAKPSTASVIKITNMPYACSRTEIVAFLGRHAQIVSQPEGSPYYAVHIMIDRLSGKTLDAYVELKHAREARHVCEQFEKRIKGGRQAKLGDREVDVSIISQADLMAEVFPTAKKIAWEGTTPKIISEREEYYPGVPSAGFNGFIPEEELTCVTKFSETPQRSPFINKSTVRSYEQVIIILYKYPWYAVHEVLLKEVNLIFDTTLRNIRALMEVLRRGTQPPRETARSRGRDREQDDKSPPTIATLQELVVAALTCPGFSEGQKYIIADSLDQGGHRKLIQSPSVNISYGGTHKYSQDWPFLALAKQPFVDDRVVEYFASLLREATTDASNLTLADLHSMRASNQPPTSFFGSVSIDYSDVKTLVDLGRAELHAIENVLSRVLLRATPTTGSRVSGASGGSRGS